MTITEKAVTEKSGSFFETFSAVSPSNKCKTKSYKTKCCKLQQLI